MQSKFWRIALSVAVAIALWAYVITTVSPESEDTFYDIPVSYQNDVLEERGLMIVSEKPTVTLTLKGNRSDLNELNENNITIVVNLAAIQAPGTQMVRYDVSYPANLPNNAFETISQTPNVLKLKVENKIKKRYPLCWNISALCRKVLLTTGKILLWILRWLKLPVLSPL